MKEEKKAILELLKASTKKKSKFENLVLNLALQKVNSDNFEFDGKAVYTADMDTLIYYLLNEEEFTIPDGVKTIGRMAFTQHDQLKKVSIPASVTKIERDSFSECSNLESITIPASVKGVYGFSFAECDKLKEVVFKGLPEHLGRRTFIGCENLRILNVPIGTAEKFKKELHIVDDPDLLVIEREPETKKESQPLQTKK